MNFIKYYPHHHLADGVCTGAEREVISFLYFPLYYLNGEHVDESVLAKSEEPISNISILIMISICYALCQFSMSTKI